MHAVAKDTGVADGQVADQSRRRPVATAWALVWAVALGASEAARAQTVDGDAGSNAAAQLLSIVGFVSTPDVTASRINVDGDGLLDGQRIDSIRLANEGVLSFGWGDLYVEGNLGFARAETDLILPRGVVPDVNVDAIGSFGGIGPSFDLGANTAIRPIAIAGIGYVGDDLNPLPVLEDTPNEVDFDLRQWTGAIGFGVNVDHERSLGRGLLDLRFKVYQVFLKTLWSADDRFAGDTSNQTINANAVYKHDTGVRLGAFPLLATGLVGANVFLGDQKDALGFAWFAEYGGGLEVDFEAADGWVKRARIRVTGIAGDGVTGISFGAGIGF